MQLICGTIVGRSRFRAQRLAKNFRLQRDVRHMKTTVELSRVSG